MLDAEGLKFSPDGAADRAAFWPANEQERAAAVGVAVEVGRNGEPTAYQPE